MITTNNGNVYTLFAINIDTDSAKVFVGYHVSNPAAAAVGGTIPNTIFEATNMPEVQAAFADPVHNGLPLFPRFEQWLVSPLSGAMELVGGTIS